MKKLSIIFTSALFVAISLSLTVRSDTAQSTSLKTDQTQQARSSTTEAGKQDKTLGERMVEFILVLVGKAPKPIDDNLVRDDI